MIRACALRLQASSIRQVCCVPDRQVKSADKLSLAIDEQIRHIANMALIALFLLGIANFALHRAVLESGHPLLGQSVWFTTIMGGKATLVLEFLVLIAAMVLNQLGYDSAVWAYLALY